MDEYEYDVEYTTDGSEYMTSDLLDQTPVTAKDIKLAHADAAKPFKTMLNDEIEYVTSNKLIEHDQYMTMVSDNQDKDFVTTTATPVAPSIQNLSANQGSWKKPVMVGAACLALIWIFKE